MLRVVGVVVERGVVTPDDIAELNSTRQIAYYKQAARILGLFDAKNEPTDRARAPAGLTEEEQRRLLYFVFEDSDVGRAWRRWSGVERLTQVDPDTASEFLTACATGLSGTTPGRRATTIRRWLIELRPFGYAEGDAPHRASPTLRAGRAAFAAGEE
jgi:hypothetical protein